MTNEQAGALPVRTMRAMLEAEYQAHERAVRAGDIDEAWHGFERAHHRAITVAAAHCVTLEDAGVRDAWS